MEVGYMPMNASGFNKALEQISSYKYFFSLDATSFDFTIPGDVYEKVISRLRARGFEQHVFHDRSKRRLPPLTPLFSKVF